VIGGKGGSTHAGDYIMLPMPRERELFVSRLAQQKSEPLPRKRSSSGSRREAPVLSLPPSPSPSLSLFLSLGGRGPSQYPRVPEEPAALLLLPPGWREERGLDVFCFGMPGPKKSNAELSSPRIRPACMAFQEFPYEPSSRLASWYTPYRARGLIEERRHVRA